MLLQLRFWEGVSVAGIARMLGSQQRSLYTRFERLRGFVRETLEKAEVRPSDVREALEMWGHEAAGWEPEDE